MTLVIALGHRFPDLDNEQRIFSAAAIDFADAVRLTAPERRKLFARADGVLLGSAPLPRHGLAAFPRCRALVRYGVGVDNVDLDEAAVRGMTVSRVPDYGSEDVALHALSLILALARRLPTASRAVSRGEWGLAGLPIPRRPAGLTLGIIGLGRIGRTLADLAGRIGFHVVGHDVMDVPGIRVAPMDDVLRRSNFVSLHLPLTAGTRHLIGRRELALMPAGSYVINTARGGLIDEAALNEAIAAGHIAGAGLDVFENEPPPTEHPLLGDARVIATPHMGWYSLEARRSLQTQAAEEMVRILLSAAPRWAISASH